MVLDFDLCLKGTVCGSRPKFCASFVFEVNLSTLFILQDLRDPLEQISDSQKQEEKKEKALQSNTDRCKKEKRSHLHCHNYADLRPVLAKTH